MLTPGELDRVIDQRDRVLKVTVPTPAHSEAMAANEYGAGQEEIAEAERLRRRVQHEVDPEPEAAEVAEADVDKVFRQAAGGVPTGYPPLRQVSAEEFRRGPVTAGHATYGVNYDLSARPAPVPSAMNVAVVSRPLLTDGRSRPCAPEAC
jgi:hypothetical protein